MRSSSVRSNYEALKGLFVIIVGVAITNLSLTAGQIIAGEKSLSGTFHGFGKPHRATDAFLAWALVLLCVRFFHGNVRLIDTMIENPHVAHISVVDATLPRLVRAVLSQMRRMGAAGAQAGEFLIIILQGAALTSFGFLLTKPQLLFFGLLFLSLTDVALFVIPFLFVGKTDRNRRLWFVLNLATVGCLCIQWLFFLPFAWAIGLMMVALFAVDYLSCWDFYFPPEEEIGARSEEK